MANKYARGVGGNWSTDATWSTTSGGTADTTKPIVGDTALLDANSGQITVDVASACDVLNCTGYINTFTLNAGLTVGGNITLVAGMTFTPNTQTVTVNATSTITSAGKAFNGFTFNAIATFTLGDNLDVNGTLTISSASIVNSYQINAGGNLTINANISGTTNIILDGTGTWTDGSGGFGINNNLTINTVGTITVSGIVTYRAGTFTYTAGTMSVGSSTLRTDGIAATTTLNVSGVAWNNFTTAGVNHTITLLSDLDVNGTFTLNATVTINGAFNIKAGGSIAINGAFDGTATLLIDGTGTWTNGGYIQKSNTTINTAGTLTISGVHYYYTGTLLYTAGTVITTGSTLTVRTGATISTSGMAWNNVTFDTGNSTLGSALDVNGNLLISGVTLNAAGYQINVAGNFTNNGTFTHGNNTVVFDGSGVTSNVAGSTTFNSFQIAAGTTVNLTATQVFSVIGTFTATGTTSSQIILKTTAGASTAGFIVSTVGIVRYVRATDINSAAGTKVTDIFGTLSNTTNWATYATGDTYWITSTTANDKVDLYVDGMLVVSYDAK